MARYYDYPEDEHCTHPSGFQPNGMCHICRRSRSAIEDEAKRTLEAAGYTVTRRRPKPKAAP